MERCGGKQFFSLIRSFVQNFKNKSLSAPNLKKIFKNAKVLHTGFDAVQTYV